MKINHKLIASLICVLGSLSVSGKALADNYVPQGPFVNPEAGSGIPGPTKVPGKEYSDYTDKDEFGAATPEQTLLWDGVGGTANGYNYGGNGEVDAMANIGDVLFNEVINNQAALLFSTGQTGIGGGNTLWDDHVLVEPIPGSVKIWATPSQIDNNGVTDVDGLEVWGEEEIPDANVFSLAGDTSGTSLYYYDGFSSSPLVSRSSIWTAVQSLYSDIGYNLQLTEDQIDVDGLMTFGSFDADNNFNGKLMFSLAPTVNSVGLSLLNDPNSNLDGGEIFVWDTADLSASFLDHGGHLWDTEFQVKEYIANNIGGNPDEISENINALEAVATPEPSSMLGLLTLGALSVRSTLKRKLKSSKSMELS